MFNMKEELDFYRANPALFSISKHPDHPELNLIRYNHLGINWDLPGALDARSIVIDDDGKLIARPYKKFFNYKEFEGREDVSEEVRELAEWDYDSEYIVQEKSDGSFILAFAYGNDILFASSSSFTSDTAIKAKEMFYYQFRDHDVIKIYQHMIKYGTSFVFELIGPDNIHVVEYDKDMLVLHDIIPTDMEDYSIHSAKQFADMNDIPFVKTYDFDLDNLIELQAYAENIEGFVVKFASGKILKIKTFEYFENAKRIDIFFGRFFTKNKLKGLVDIWLEGSFDDLYALSSNRPKVRAKLELVRSFIDRWEMEMDLHRQNWSLSDGSPLEPHWDFSEFEKEDLRYGREKQTLKEVALDKEYSKEDRANIFLSLKMLESEQAIRRSLEEAVLREFSEMEG